mgnify:CR=1 FL=1|tara:strand:+ start:280 stop:1362 length:1083 start_codon:yes stop_codon:yes gene_type:complete
MIYNNKNIVTSKITIQQAIKTLEKTKIKCLIVIDKKNKQLVGSLTDGDIRRFILKGNKYNSSINGAIKKKIKFFKNSNFNRERIFKLLNNKIGKIDIVPIINEKKEIVKLISLRNLIKRKSSKNRFVSRRLIKKLKLVIMAGGKGTRLKPFTQILPKPLIPVKGKAVIEHIIKTFTDQNFTNFTFTINFKSKILKSYFEELAPAYKCNFVMEKTPLGTAGSLKLINTKNVKCLLVTNCDTIINIDYKKFINFHIENKNLITIVAAKKDFKIPYGKCEVNSKGNFLRILEKPSQKILINTGMYILSSEVLKKIKKNKKIDMTNIISSIPNKYIGIYPIYQNQYKDIGEWNEYKKTINSLKF